MKKTFIFAMTVFCLFCLFGCGSNIEYEEYIVTIVDGEAVEGKELLDSFYLRTKRGEKLKIIFNKSYTDSGDEYSFYIIYDGEYYITNDKILESDPQETKFKYLNYSETDGDGRDIVKTEAYCLSNDENMTYERIVNSWLSSALENIIFDSFPVYCTNYFVDLCFYNTELESIIYNSRKYAVNFSNKFTAREMVDCLSWDKKPLENYGNNNWTLRLNMNRTIQNDANHLLLGEKNSTIFVEYLFDFEKKIAVMHYPANSSLTGQLYANLTDECIEKTSGLFSVFQGQSFTNWGEYCSDILSFEINEDDSGIIKVIGTNTVEKIYSVIINIDGILILKVNNGKNYYAFTVIDENNGGYTYVSEKSNPTVTMSKYFKDSMFFQWLGYPCY